MKLTRKQLNAILLQLPHPSFAEHGKIPPIVKVPILEPMQVVPVIFKTPIRPQLHSSNGITNSQRG